MGGRHQLGTVIFSLPGPSGFPLLVGSVGGSQMVGNPDKMSLFSLATVSKLM